MNQTRIKKSLFGLLAGGMLAAAFAFSEYAAYEPYTLSYNSTYAGSHEGIQAGWTLDNRGGNLRVSIAGGYDVKLSEVHGMAQRGGSVVTFVRYGESVAEPIVEEGQADILIAFERGRCNA